MPITLVEAKVGMADKVDQKIVDNFRRESRLLDLLTFDDAVSPGTGGSTLTYGYVQLKTPGTAQVRAINSEYTPQESKREDKSVKLAIMGGSFEIDRVLAKTSGAVNEVAFQIDEKSKAVANLFTYNAIKGTRATVGYDGLEELLKGTANVVQSAVDISTASARDTNYQSAMDELDELQALMDVAPTLWLMNKTTKAHYVGIARRCGYYTRGEDAFGKQIDKINGVEIMEVGKYFNGTSSVEIIPTGDVYGVYLGLDGFHAVSPIGNTAMLDKHLPDFTEAKAVHKGDVELVSGVVLKSTLKAVHLKAYSKA